MKIVRILGGLGNQMFQYAFALALHERFQQEIIKIDPSAFNGYPLHSGYQIKEIFGECLPIASRKDILKVNYPYFHYRLWQIGKRVLPKLKSVKWEVEDMVYDESIFNLQTSDLYFDGYWQTERYFNSYRELIIEKLAFPELDPKNKGFMERFKGENIVSVHVRRGDYLKEPLFKGLTDLDYYKRAIAEISRRIKVDAFLIFSNDITWCRENITPLCKVKCEFIDWNTGRESYRDMQLMSLCSHNIIANSSFSWWGAWLNPNPNKIVIAPRKWINRSTPNDIIPDSWLRI